jgi:uncharacterized protein (TIGR02646 family)
MFLYPKSLHRRSYAPRVLKNYRRYKPYLQRDFGRTCVYCREPDTLVPRPGFGVDHYKPKSMQQFAGLECDYANLYYCCSGCNSRKKDYWPQDESVGPFVVNPCDFVMGDHLRFNAATARMEPRSHHGKHMVNLLQLNAEELVRYREQWLHLHALYEREVVENERQKSILRKRLRTQKIAQADYDYAVIEIDSELATCKRGLEMLNGTMPLSQLRQVRFGVQMHK